MTDREKLSAIIDSLCFGNKAEFARTIKTSPQTITNWMNRGISKDGLIIIKKSFPDINPDWLFNGEGEMLREKFEDSDTSDESEYIYDHGDVSAIPLINIDSVGGVHSENLITSSEQYVERMVPFPGTRHGDVAIYQTGDSMAPTIPAGAILQIRRVEGWREYFGYGNVYVLWLQDERRITKLVKRYDPDPHNYVMCCSYNPVADDEELPRSMIKEVWKVVNVLINKGW